MAAKASLAGPEAAKARAAQLRAEVAQIRDEIKERLRARGMPEDYLNIRYECAEGDDTGWLDEYHRLPCTCRSNREIEILMESAGISRTWRGFDEFDERIYPTEEQRKQGRAARMLCEDYANRFPELVKPNLLLMGESGLGKTFFLEAIAERMKLPALAGPTVTAFRMLGRCAPTLSALWRGRGLPQMVGATITASLTTAPSRCLNNIPWNTCSRCEERGRGPPRHVIATEPPAREI